MTQNNYLRRRKPCSNTRKLFLYTKLQLIHLSHDNSLANFIKKENNDNKLQTQGSPLTVLGIQYSSDSVQKWAPNNYYWLRPSSFWPVDAVSERWWSETSARDFWRTVGDALVGPAKKSSSGLFSEMILWCLNQKPRRKRQYPYMSKKRLVSGRLRRRGQIKEPTFRCCGLDAVWLSISWSRME